MKNIGLLNRCIQSILDNTKKDTFENDLEIIVVSNGYEWINFLDVEDFDGDLPGFYKNIVKHIDVNQPIGYPKAINIGISASTGEKIILMNDDCEILGFEDKDRWLEMLAEPLNMDPAIGMTGIKDQYSEATGKKFLIFFMVMFRRNLIKEIGLLDESFTPGGSEDIDFCARVEKAGYKLETVVKKDNGDDVTGFPLYHEGGKTVHTLAHWEEMFAERTKIVADRNKKFMYDTHADVTAYISTRGRYNTTLPSALQSIASQTLLPKKVVLYQDDPESFDLRKSNMYKGILSLFERKGIAWEVVYGNGNGQVINHQHALDNADTEWMWRLDDDNIAEPDVLERLCGYIADGVGAVAGSVIDPSFKSVNTGKSTDIKDINISLNYQWTNKGDVRKVQHLYSTFIYRTRAGEHGYNKNLSPAGHREETMFTYDMYLAGWDLIVDPKITTWHLREPLGGIRSFDDNSYWESDERVFKQFLKERNIVLTRNVYINLDCGLGDHWVFKMMLDELLFKHRNDTVIIGACFPDVFSDVKSDNCIIRSVSDCAMQCGPDEFEKLNIYRYCIEKGWNGRLIDAFKELYLK